ncbi:MAG: energy-coupling factor transporter ATPase [Clostridia bacterium]|nr:energy-coupling factor transporter ATPase [Clostridia bacterium]
MDNSTVCRIEHVTSHYTTEDDTQKLVLDDISLDIRRGEFLAVLGRNGSGKSTLAKHLNAILLPSGGKVWVDGMDTTDEELLFEIRRRVGMVFQNPDNQLVSSVVEDDIAFGPENLGVSREEIRARVDEALEAVGLTEYKDRSPHMLSGGQKQRVAIAGIIAMRPDVVVLDEPTAMLDPKGRDEVMETMMLLNKGIHMTVVLITHFMEEAIMADRVCVLSDGKLALSGSPASVFSEEETLQKLGLTLPPAAAIAQGLRKEGYPIPKDCLTMDALAKAICPYLKEGFPCSH